MSSNQVAAIVAQLSGYTKSHFHWLNCVVCKLYLSKAVAQKVEVLSSSVWAAIRSSTDWVAHKQRSLFLAVLEAGRL